MKSKYLPSLEERKQRFLESCADCGSDGGGDEGLPDTEPGLETTELPTPLNKFLKKRKKKNGA